MFLFCALLYFLNVIYAIYLPGVAPKSYQELEKVPLTVNSLRPMAGPIPGSVLQYYKNRFHFCNNQGAKALPESLGSIIFGDRIFTSDFEIFMAKNESCKLLCLATIPSSDVDFVVERVLENYGMNWLVDGLPAAGENYMNSAERVYSLGFPLGTSKDSINVEINNHYHITIEYHKLRNSVYRVVGVSVNPSSIMSTVDSGGKPNCLTKDPYMLRENQDNQIVYTYDVSWRESDVTWATRWDKYLYIYNPRIHWFNLFSSSMIVFFLVGMVITVLARTLHKDIMRYNSVFFDQEELQEDSGWKLVHGDVFRIPNNPMLLSILLGSGAQLFLMVFVTIFFAMLGFLSPSNRGSLSTFMIVLYTFFGFISGYVSSRMLKNLLLTPIFVPGIVFLTFSFLNFVLISSGSSGVVPLKTMFVIVALWFLISVPLSIIGSFYGFHSGPIIHPVKTNQIPRQIPTQVSYIKFIPSFFIGGILPFGAIFVFGLVVYIICLVFFFFAMLLWSLRVQLWWRSFFVGGASSFYVFVNSMLFWFSRIRLSSFSSHILYLGYSFLFTFLIFILTGTIGFLSSYFFIRKIYGSIKIDEIQKHPIQGFSAGLIDDNNVYEWEVLIIGPEDTLYEGGFFRCRLSFPLEYPHLPPKMRFITELYHPNVYADGLVCISILHPPGEDKFGYEDASERWRAVHTPETILLSVISMLSSPNFDSPANIEAAKHWRDDPQGFKKKVRRLVRQSAENFE
ncbi:hypothetical protein PORY_000047 [Pneumocystis oryctolagi]|uniref:Uncharacterized protein n=1 Tax=Pneumocystis oryctolagi TaxID=42067 RepID=A0ACB7CGE5_9ASCO|nr:hypothetical protein PORY_000047 [Pneumocystis oryctolagi]